MAHRQRQQPVDRDGRRNSRARPSPAPDRPSARPAARSPQSALRFCRTSTVRGSGSRPICRCRSAGCPAGCCRAWLRRRSVPCSGRPNSSTGSGRKPSNPNQRSSARRGSFCSRHQAQVGVRSACRAGPRTIRAASRNCIRTQGGMTESPPATEIHDKRIGHRPAQSAGSSRSVQRLVEPRAAGTLPRAGGGSPSCASASVGVPAPRIC